MMDDLISRQAAIDTSLEFFVEFIGGAFHENAQKELIARIQRLPSVQPRKWKWVDDGTEFGCCCSECGSTLDDYFDGLTEDVRLMKIPNFCINCGADMRGEQE